MIWRDGQQLFYVHMHIFRSNRPCLHQGIIMDNRNGWVLRLEPSHWIDKSIPKVHSHKCHVTIWDISQSSMGCYQLKNWFKIYKLIIHVLLKVPNKKLFTNTVILKVPGCKVICRVKPRVRIATPYLAGWHSYVRGLN